VNVKSGKLLDAFSLVRFFKKERGSERVKALLLNARRAGIPLMMTEINAGELYYTVARKLGVGHAEEALASLSTIPVTLLPTTWELTLAAARLKAQWAISYADCFALATAIDRQVSLVTGDPEFKRVAHLVSIEWV
jgi:ribonuclease VapC